MFCRIGVRHSFVFSILATGLLTGCQSTAPRSAGLKMDQHPREQALADTEDAVLAEQTPIAIESVAGTSIQGMPSRVDHSPIRRMSRTFAFCNT